MSKLNMIASEGIIFRSVSILVLCYICPGPSIGTSSHLGCEAGQAGLYQGVCHDVMFIS